MEELHTGLQIANYFIRNATRETATPTPPPGLDKQQLFYWKLKNDFAWYAEHFLKIRDKHSKLVPFRINDAQLIVESIDKYCREHEIPRRYIVLKARQMGLSTYTEGKLFHSTSTHEFTNSMIIAHQDIATQNLFAMSKLYYDELPELIRPMKRLSNEKALTFENPGTDEEKKKNPGLRSKYSVHTANTVEAGRSSTIHNLHASEVAFFPNAKTTMLGLLQCVPDTMDTMVVLESTANGVGDYFHDMWQKAVRGENDFIPIFLPWFTDKSYTKPFRSYEERESFIAEVEQTHQDMDGKTIRTEESLLREKHNLTYEQLNWRRWAIKNKCAGDEEGFRQEYPSTPEEAFIATGRPRFSISALRKYSTVTKQPLATGYLKWVTKGKSVKFEEDAKGYVQLWKLPKDGEFYCIGADVAEGLVDGDYSCGLVGDQEFDICASWYGHIDPDLFGEELVKLAIFYNSAYLGVEANNHGLTCLKAIQRLEYWNIYFQKTYDKIADQISTKMGWTTSLKTKPMMIDKLAEFVREFYLGIYWDVLISEMTTYVIEDNGSTNAQDGCHDDTVMACAILLQVLLEGKGDNYAPENVDERSTTNRGATREIVDDLFEKNEGKVEHT